MKRYTVVSKIAGCALALLSLAGCGLQTSTEEGATENVDAVEQAIALGDWHPGAYGPTTVGMAMTSSNTYQWTNVSVGTNQWLVCRGLFDAPCNTTGYAYVMEPTSPSEIKAVGISRTNGHVYAWYNHGGIAKFSEGTSSNLGALQPFLLPPGVTINNLIEVDMSTNGSWYYWWNTTGGVRYSTSKTATNGGTALNWGTVNVLSSDPIVGIAFDTSNPAAIWTFYSNSTGSVTPMDISSSPLDLAQL